MKGSEFLALVMGLYSFVGILLNYNLLYSRIHNTRPWWLTRRHSDGFYLLHKRMRWALYIGALFWVGIFAILFVEGGLWITSVLLGFYLATRIPAWFILGPRTNFRNKHNALKNLGPSGRHEPSVVKSNFRIADVDNLTPIL